MPMKSIKIALLVTTLLLTGCYQSGPVERFQVNSLPSRFRVVNIQSIKHTAREPDVLVIFVEDTIGSNDFLIVEHANGLAVLQVSQPKAESTQQGN